MYYTYHRISKQVYDYCLKNKIVDAGLIAKWKKPGYERLCSTYVINPANYKFGTTSICRVPIKDRPETAKNAQDPTTGCLGCASGKDAGPRNIFGNKYGQNLAAVQIAREKRREEMEKKRQEEEEREEERRRNRRLQHEDDDSNDDHSDEEEDDDDDDDFGPNPAAGIWAGSQKLQAESEAIAEGEEDVESDEEEYVARPNKKSRSAQSDMNPSTLLST